MMWVKLAMGLLTMTISEAIAGPCGCEKLGETFCNYDDGASGTCERCEDVATGGDLAQCDPDNSGLQDDGAADCRKWCQTTSTTSTTIETTKLEPLQGVGLTTAQLTPWLKVCSATDKVNEQHISPIYSESNVATSSTSSIS